MLVIKICSSSIMLVSKKLFNSYFGTTTVHLQNEFVLLATMCLFTSASFCTMYHSNDLLFQPHISSTLESAQNSNGSLFLYLNWKEITYILLSTAWLGRHLMQRVICTTEANTSTSQHGRLGVHVQYLQHPSIVSIACKIWIWICYGGQYFDIRSCPIRSSLYEGQPSSSLSSLALSGSLSNTRGSGKTRTHRSMNKGYSGHFLHEKTPPIHRIYVVQVFFIIPFIVIPLAISKLVISNLRSKKRVTRGYYDSDDDDTANTSGTTTDRQRRRRRGDYSHSQKDFNDQNKHADSDISENNDGYHHYMKIHFQTQNQVNSQFDFLWRYIPAIQFQVFFFVLAFVGYIGFQFHTHCHDSLAGSSHAFKGNKQFGYENYAKYNNLGMNSGFQPYANNLYPGGPSSVGNFGSQSTILNAELMAQRFEMKQRNIANEIGSNASYSPMHFLFSKVLQTRARVNLIDWKLTYYSPWGMLYLMTLWGILSSLILFGRVMLPIPDLASKGRDSWAGKGASVSS